jgi:hypothetical protein
MKGIQVVLVLAAFLWLARFLAHGRTRGLGRVLAVLAAAGTIVLVVFPDLSVGLARLAGVGRGVDLVIYLSIVALAFLGLHLAARQQELEAKLVELTRELALRVDLPSAVAKDGRGPGEHDPTSATR